MSIQGVFPILCLVIAMVSKEIIGQRVCDGLSPGNLFSNNEAVFFPEARDYCQQNGGKLVEPRNAEEHEAIRDFMVNHVGLAEDGSEPYWIGVKDPENDASKLEYVFSDGPVLWNNFEDGLPRPAPDNDEVDDQTCVDVYGPEFKWYDVKCEGEGAYTDYAACVCV